MKSQKMEFRSILKDVEYLSSPHMTWKERKEMENRKVVALGGKPPKKHRLPLNVARVMMKKQKEKDEKIQQEIAQFGGNHSGISSSSGSEKVEKRRPEDRVLKSIDGHFKNGVLNVKHLFQPSGSNETDGSQHVERTKGKKKMGGKKNSGKKGRGKKRH